jgi:predicted RNA binding protein YcfA (HicA-like mRNA interferase family)
LKLPRDLSGEQLSRLLHVFGYVVARQTGSHMRVTTSLKGPEHHITIPRHKYLKIGTLSAVLGEVAQYLEMTREDLAEALFG